MLDYLLSYARPLGITLTLALASIPLGFVLAVLVTLWRRVPNFWIALPARAFVYFFRGTPLFVQLYLIWFGGRSLFNPRGLAGLEAAEASPLWILLYGGLNDLFDQHLLVGILALALNTTAYTAEILHGALDAVPLSNLEAARAYGFSRGSRFLRILFPLALRQAWPAYSNEVIFLTHATALVYAVLSAPLGFGDLFRHSRNLGESDYNLLLHIPVAMAIYLLLSLSIFALLAAIERRWHPPAATRPALTRSRWRWLWPGSLLR